MSDQIDNDSSHGLVKLLDMALHGRKYQEALQLIDDSQYDVYFEEGSAWDLIPLVCKNISPKTLDTTPDLVRCCEELLISIAKRAHPEESVLEFIELAECIENNVLFLAVLNPMQTCLKRKVQRGHFLQFCLNAIEYHIVNQKVPHADEENEDEDQIVATYDSICEEITELYLASHKFYEPFVSEAMLYINTCDVSDQIQNERMSLICFIMQLLGKPLAFFNLSDNNPKTAARTIAELLIFDLTRLCSDLLKFLEYAEIRETKERKTIQEKLPFDEPSNDSFLLENKVPTFSIGILYYLIYVEEILLCEVPCVYSTMYVLQISLYLSTKLMQEDNHYIIEKGLKLADKLLGRVEEFEIPSKMLELPTIEIIVRALTFAVVYNPSAKLRQVALKVLKTLIFKFDHQGRYLLMCNMYHSVTHSGLLGYLITELKEMINSAITVHPKSTPFTGKRLFTLLKLYCTLPDVAVKDIFGVSSQITASLNLLRFVIIRDKENVTGIWDHLDYFEEYFFEPLTKTIDMSRESIKIELQNVSKKINQPIALPKETDKNSIDMSITVSGKEIPVPSIDEENTTQQFYDTLNVLDVMASVLFRVKECIQLGSPNKKQPN